MENQNLVEQYFNKYFKEQDFIQFDKEFKALLKMLDDKDKKHSDSIIIEIDFDGHLKAQIQTFDANPNVLKAVNGYGQPVDCKEVRINEV